MSVTTRQVPQLDGVAVRLRAVEEADLPLLVRWMNDPEVRHWLHHSDRPDATVDSVRGRFGLTEERFPNLVWLIEMREGRPVGHVGLLQVDLHHKRAELAISIGEKDCWSRGLGTDAVRTVLRHGFEDLGLRRVDLHTDADNARGIRCYEKCGFVREGVMRARRLRYGEPLDMVLMAVLSDEWLGRGE
ncbi:MAG: GNAT family N-acetyltransferase [Chloroflexi bacterium]|nr:MAG: GNAT family N-acetyltransferase [Chloroflexota bacterium]